MHTEYFSAPGFPHIHAQIYATYVDKSTKKKKFFAEFRHFLARFASFVVIT